MFATRPEWAPGTRIANYVVIEEIARGGQGVVLKAKHAELGSLTAIKVLLDPNEQTRRRFRQEAKALAHLRHPNLLGVPDFGTLPDGTPYMVMEFVEGNDLKKIVSQAGVPKIEWAAKVLRTVAQTLQFCHDNGVIHRDVKPQNILIEHATGRPVLVDFGLIKRDRLKLAWSTKDGTSLTQEGELMGTPAYMPPEQADPETFGEISPRTDVYSLGATLYYLLTGEAPFTGATAYNIILALMQKEPVGLRERNPKVPDALADLCMACLAKDTGARPISAEVFAEELRAAAAPSELGRPVKKAWVNMLVPAGIVAVGLVAAGVLVSRAPGPPPPSRAPQLTVVPTLPPTTTFSPPPKAPLPVAESPPSAARASLSLAPEPTLVEAAGPRFAVKAADGEVLGRGTVSTRDCPYRHTADYITKTWAIGNVDADPELEVVLLLHQRHLYPGLVVVIDADGSEQWRYWHPGRLLSVFLHDEDGDGVEEIYAAGVNNVLGDEPGSFYQQVVLCLDASTWDRSPSTQYPGPERWYTALGMSQGEIRTIRLDGADLALESSAGYRYLAKASDGRILIGAEVPAEARAAVAQGLTNLQAGLFREAVADLSEAIRLSPSGFAEAYAHRNRAAAREGLGDWQGAIDDWERALELDPNASWAPETRRNLHLAQEFAEAFGRGVARVKSGDYHGAVEDLTEAIRVKPDYAQSYVLRGSARTLLGELEEAIKDQGEAIRLQPDHAGAYAARGDAREKRGNLQGTIEDWERALELEPNAPFALEIRQNLQIVRQKLAEQQGGGE